MIPETSLEALRYVEATGQRRTNGQYVIAAVRHAPGMTASELATSLGMDAVEVRRRLNDALNNGVLTKGRARRASGRPTSENEWLPAERQAALL